MVIFSVGVRPNSYLAKSCNLKVNQGIIVNDNMETSVPGIFAAGDIAEHRGVLYGLWNAAMFQGKIAGMNAAGKKTDFGGIPRSNTLKVLDVDLFSIGSFNACDGSCRFVEHKTEETYAFYLFRDGKIEGVVLFGDTSQSALVKTAVEDKINLPMSLIEKRDLNEILGFLSRQI
jgi:nitrite reductase (NADH) large subunit